MYISLNSGHHKASLAIQDALSHVDSSIDVLNINAFNYTNPILEKVINKTYTGIVKNTPEVWDYLYDNPAVFKKIQGLRDIIHNFNSEKLKSLLDSFQPDVIACTQAFPCGMIADLKKQQLTNATLFGVLTDYNPHYYWIYDSVDYYITASQSATQRLLQCGVNQKKIKTFGIPVNPSFNARQDTKKIKKKLGLSLEAPTILVMGGGQGLGPIKETIKALDNMDIGLQSIVVAGTNKRLFKWLTRGIKKGFKKHILALEYSNNISDLMDASDLVITKPGGLTTAEALAKGLPIIIINPLPGQEAKNTQFLASIEAAKKVDSYLELPSVIKELVNNPDKLESMRKAAFAVGKPNSAGDVAKLIAKC